EILDIPDAVQHPQHAMLAGDVLEVEPDVAGGPPPDDDLALVERDRVATAHRLQNAQDFGSGSHGYSLESSVRRSRTEIGRCDARMTGILPEGISNPQGSTSGPADFANRQPRTGIPCAVAIASRLNPSRLHHPPRGRAPGALRRHRRCRKALTIDTGPGAASWRRAARPSEWRRSDVGHLPPAVRPTRSRGRTPHSGWDFRATLCAV